MRFIRVLVVASFAFVALLVIALTFDSSLMSEYLTGLLIQSVAKHGVTLSIGSLSPLFIGVKLTAIKAFFAKSLISLSIDVSQTTCSAISALSGEASCQIEASLYGGSVESTLAASQSEGAMSNITLQRVQLSQHPQLAGLGIEQGTLDIENAALSWGPHGIQSAKASLQISDLSKPTQTILSQRLTGLPVPISLPPITAEKIVAELSLSNNLLEIASLDLRSTLGSLSGSFSMPIAKGHRKMPSLEVSLSLTESGVVALKPHLVFLCEASLLTAGTPLLLRSNSTQGLGVSCTRN